MAKKTIMLDGGTGAGSRSAPMGPGIRPMGPTPPKKMGPAAKALPKKKGK